MNVIRKPTLTVLFLASLGTTAMGCATKQPTQELVDARMAYQRAARGPAAQANPAGLFDAKRSLDAAERAQSDKPGSIEARDLAYVAQRKTQIAETNARTVIIQNQEATTVRALEKTREEALESAKRQLGESTQKLDAERNARAAAEARAQQALASLTAIAAVKQGPKGATVITLPGGVLFETGKSELLPSAREKLDRVADALKQAEGKRIDVVGYTDNVGADASNMQLSKRRAESVRQYLITRQIPADRLTAEGKGEENPVASNATPDGRAMNRRVELVVEGADETK